MSFDPVCLMEVEQATASRSAGPAQGCRKTRLSNSTRLPPES